MITDVSSVFTQPTRLIGAPAVGTSTPTAIQLNSNQYILQYKQLVLAGTSQVQLFGTAQLILTDFGAGDRLKMAGGGF